MTEIMKRAYKNSEFASHPKNELEEKFVLIHKCTMCGGDYFCSCVKDPSCNKCECKNSVCFVCFMLRDDVDGDEE